MCSEPLVSFVTPVYNGARYIGECIESVLAQEYANWEYVILDNHSDDGSAAIIERYARREPRIRVHRNGSVLPIMANWNAALARISPASRYCKVVHADDRLFARCTRAMVESAERFPSAGLIGAYSLWGNWVVGDGLAPAETCITGHEMARRALLGQVYPFISPSALLIRADLVRRKGGFYAGAGLHADVAACYEALRAHDFGFVHEVLTFIGRHDDSVTATEAAPMERIRLSNMALLTTYGPLFLTPGEYRARFGEVWRRYLCFLARSALEGRPAAFWAFHRQEVQALGLPLNRMRLLRAVLRELAHRPVASLKRFWHSRAGTGARRNRKTEVTLGTG
ncbi:MAG: glycosyltransferase [Gammaproteobacteria bacterium]|nr:glycosyltransferase [Gammaproteobacteria bacterium]